MNNHLTDADLVALALLPDDAPDARIHLASCASCAARLDRANEELEKHRRAHEASVESHDATFWKRQELSIMSEVSRVGRRSSPRRSLIAAAILAVAVGGFWFGRTSVDEPSPAPGALTVVAQNDQVVAPATQSGLVPATEVFGDPWETESLSEFQPVVDWESWVDADGKDEGTI